MTDQVTPQEEEVQATPSVAPVVVEPAPYSVVLVLLGEDKPIVVGGANAKSAQKSARARLRAKGLTIKDMAKIRKSETSITFTNNFELPEAKAFLEDKEKAAEAKVEKEAVPGPDSAELQVTQMNKLRSKKEIIEFMGTNYQLVLDPETKLAEMRSLSSDHIRKTFEG